MCKELEDWQGLFWGRFGMYMYVYMHMFGLREPMVKPIGPPPAPPQLLLSNFSWPYQYSYIL